MIVQALNRQTPATILALLLLAAVLTALRGILGPEVYQLKTMGVLHDFPGYAGALFTFGWFLVLSLHWNFYLGATGIQPRDLVVALLTFTGYMLVPSSGNLNQILAAGLAGLAIIPLSGLQDGQEKKATRALFKQGVWLGLAALLSWESLILSGLIVIALLLYGFLKIRYFLVFCMGSAWVVGLAFASMYFFTESFQSKDLVEHMVWHSAQFTPSEILWVGFVVVAIAQVFPLLQRYPKGPRKAMALWSWILALCTILGLIMSTDTTLFWMTAVPGLGLLLSFHIRRVRKQWHQDILIGLLWGAAVISSLGG